MAEVGESWDPIMVDDGLSIANDSLTLTDAAMRHGRGRCGCTCVRAMFQRTHSARCLLRRTSPLVL
jgi:hypothetical protein